MGPGEYDEAAAAAEIAAMQDEQAREQQIAALATCITRLGIAPVFSDQDWSDYLLMEELLDGELSEDDEAAISTLQQLRVADVEGRVVKFENLVDGQNPVRFRITDEYLNNCIESVRFHVEGESVLEQHEFGKVRAIKTQLIKEHDPDEMTRKLRAITDLHLRPFGNNLSDVASAALLDYFVRNVEQLEDFPYRQEDEPNEPGSKYKHFAYVLKNNFMMVFSVNFTEGHIRVGLTSPEYDDESEEVDRDHMDQFNDSILGEYESIIGTLVKLANKTMPAQHWLDTHVNVQIPSKVDITEHQDGDGDGEQYETIDGYFKGLDLKQAPDYLKDPGQKAFYLKTRRVPEYQMFDDIYGQDDVLEELRDFLFDEEDLPELKFRKINTAKTVAFIGEKGSGKTMFKFATANELGATDSYFEVHKGVFVSPYVGLESRHVRTYFEMIRKVAAETEGYVVMALEEADSTLGTRHGNGPVGDAGAVTDVVNSILPEIENLPDNVVFIITTNNGDKIDDAILREKRMGIKFIIEKLGSDKLEQIFKQTIQSQLEIDDDWRATEEGASHPKLEFEEGVAADLARFSAASEMSPADAVSAIDKAVTAWVKSKRSPEGAIPVITRDMIMAVLHKIKERNVHSNRQPGFTGGWR